VAGTAEAIFLHDVDENQETSMPRFFQMAFALAIPLVAVACFVDSNDHGGSRGGMASAGSGSSSGGSSTGVAGNGSASAYPITAKVDTDQTMQVSPGQGVGVFTEYVSGGHWHVWWTCDTNVNPQGAPCSFDVKITAAQGKTFTNVASQNFEPADTFSSSQAELDATTTTSTGFDGLLFDTAPGDTITISATVGGLYDGRFLFFVEDGKIDDGTQTTVTDPILLTPTSP
jgi:hypothetical protein